ncbi:MAG TPA: hypothetical protein VM925_23715, partial [Labilithrix sp.]|nr:hypothetical protein [Labilithrix sp.]
VKFCADFEDPTVSHFGFTNWSLASGCSTVHTGERGTSLRCQCGKPGADDFANYQYSLLRKAHVVIDYDVAVESYGNVRANFVGLGTTDASREAVLTFSSSESANIFWRTPTTSGTVALNVSVPTGEWLYVREEFDFSAATPRLTAWVGTTRGDATKIGPTELAADFAVGTLHVAFGIGYSPPATSPTTLLLDNITVDTFD